MIAVFPLAPAIGFPGFPAEVFLTTNTALSSSAGSVTVPKEFTELPSNNNALPFSVWLVIFALYSPARDKPVASKSKLLPFKLSTGSAFAGLVFDKFITLPAVPVWVIENASFVPA